MSGSQHSISPSRSGYRALSLATYLARLVWLSVLPLLLLAVWLVYHGISNRQVERDREAQNLASNLAGVIDQYLEARISALHMLVTSPLLDDRRRWPELYREAVGFRESFGSHVILASAEEPRQMLFNTRLPFGSPLPVLPRPRGRAAAPTAIATGKPAVGDLFIAPLAKVPMVSIAAPTQRAGKVAFVMVTIFETGTFQQRLERVALPEGWTLSLLDGRGDVIARRATRTSDVNGRGDVARRFVAPSQVSPWSVAVEIQRAAHRTPLFVTAALLGAGVLIATLAGVLGGMLGCRRLSRAMDSLLNRTGEGETSRIIEIEATRTKLSETIEAQKQARLEALEQMEIANAARRDAEEALIALRKHEALLKVVGRTAQIGGWDLDPASGEGHWTEEVARIHDLDPATQPNREMGLAFYRPESRARLEAALAQTLRSGTPYDLELEIVSAKGIPRWIRTIGLPVVRKGAVVKLHGSIQDITNRKRTETALRESEERQRLFIRYAPAALAMFDRNMRYLHVSNRWRHDYGLGNRDLAMLSYYDDFPGLPGAWKEAHRRGLAGEVIRKEMDRFERADGTLRWLRWEIRPWRDAGGEIGGILIFTEDITDMRQAQEEISHLNTDLERRVAARTAELQAANQELDAFAYAVSHDLRPPLRAMNGFSQILIEDYGEVLDREGRDHLGEIVAASRTMGGLIDGLLTLSRSTRGELTRESVDLGAMAHRIREELERSEPEYRVTWEIAEGLRATGDGPMLEIALRNLLGNAWKYGAHAVKPLIRLYGEERDGKPWICVADNGAGFDMAHAERLFKPFQRLHRQEEFPGIGIGLATVQRIINRHGGVIQAEGTPGRGATFRFTLP